MVERLGTLFFKWRSYTPIPLLLAVLILARPSLPTIVIGMAVSFLGEAIRIWAVANAGGGTRTLEPGVGDLITGGPFSFVRNPLYVGNFIMSLGLVVAAWPSRWALQVPENARIPWMIPVFLAAFAVQYGFIVALEERTLRAKLGPVFDDYCRAVPRWLPRFTPYPTRYPEHGDFKAAVRADRRSIQSMCLVLLVVIGIFVFRTVR